MAGEMGAETLEVMAASSALLVPPVCTSVAGVGIVASVDAGGVVALTVSVGIAVRQMAAAMVMIASAWGRFGVQLNVAPLHQDTAVSAVAMGMSRTTAEKRDEGHEDAERGRRQRD
jgi:hypothetical protein